MNVGISSDTYKNRCKPFQSYPSQENCTERNLRLQLFDELSPKGEVFRDETIPVVVHFSLSEDTVCTVRLEGDYDDVYYWQIPDFMTDSLFADFLTDIVDAISDQDQLDTKKFLQLLHPSPEELRRLNQKRIKWFYVSDDETHRRVRENVKSFGDIVPYPSIGNITSVDVRINNETDPSGELRSKINQLIASTNINIECYAESDGAEETDECLDSFVDNENLSDEEEEIDKEVQANPEKPCYYPAQIEMAAILKKRIDTIMSYYHQIPRLSDVFNDVEFVVYTARYRMLSDQTEKRICHPNAGVLSKEELESRKDCSGKKRMFMYVRSQETETHFEELKTNVQEKTKNPLRHRSRRVPLGNNER
ncbi:hypothetical protein OS493_004633 [Desmophyllum pertusum]|uniref:GREB1-like circularly permuted SF2 helicase domain-containing protein n=1 Tax=Desmophyllum pertusum TaxID=174260 RepID=A0A9W9ZG40_9CNID|nr:hypothetical protein OS493_004633 [Desmophyllum pertusum]